MPERYEIRQLLEKLQSSADDNRPQSDPYEDKTSALAPYRRHQVWPGERYTLLGTSYNLESRIFCRVLEERRAGCMAIVFESHGDRYSCIPVGQALAIEGLSDVLSGFERDWLEKLPDETLLGPAYSPAGQRIRTAFAVWRFEPEQVSTKRVLLVGNYDKP
jgi:hypothetical protein